MALMNDRLSGWLNGLAGVVIFSGSLPATRLAVVGLDPLFVTVARASFAAVIAMFFLFILKEKWPQKSDLPSLAITSIGVVLGFPLLTALALQYVTSAHSIVFIGLLPLSTAIFGVLRAKERPKPAFWLFSCLGSGLVAGFALSRGVEASPLGDGLMLAAIVICGLGYAEGGKLSRSLGGWQVICWALVLALPVMAPLVIYAWPANPASIGISAWVGLGYVTVFSMLIGFIFWYRGLAKGGIASVGQLQLLQPFLGLIIAALLLGEDVEPMMIVATIGVVACVALARRFT